MNIHGLSQRGALGLVFLLLAAAGAPAQPQDKSAAPASPPPPAAADVPYSLRLQSFSIPGLPGLHSFAAAGDPSRLVLLAGRTNGLHGFSPSRQAATHPSFPPQNRNDTVYVVDLVGRRLLGQAKVTSLPSPYQQQYTASNVQYSLAGDFLYVVGGYGPSPDTGALLTLPYLTVVDFAALVSTVTSGGALDAAFAQKNMASFQHPALAIAGGDLIALGGKMLLVYGHRFDGEYTPGGGLAIQEYSNSVRAFTIAAARSASGVTLDVKYLGSQPNVTTGMDPDNPYHRRDLTVKPALTPAGTPRIGVYGGVFKGGRMEGYVNPIYITADGANPLGFKAEQDASATQLLSQYDCATIQLHSGATASMYSTFFGGISFYYWDASCQCLKHDPVQLNTPPLMDGLPFINSISTLKVTGGGSRQFLHAGATVPPAGQYPQCSDGTNDHAAAYLGAETKFIKAPGIPATNEVIELDALTAPAVVGYLVGGIAAVCSGNPANCYASTQGNSCASSLVYEVTLDPRTPTKTIALQPPA